MQEKKQKKIKASGTPAILAGYLGGEGLTPAFFAGYLMGLTLAVFAGCL
jgi:hypothetical protein